jgi:hypothetical protein
MTDGNYQALSKILGKLAYFFDQAGAGSVSQEAAFAAMFDQVAKPDTAANNEIVVDFAGAAQGLFNNIATGGATQQAALVAAGKKYLASDLVIGSFVTNVPAANASAAQVIAALILEMTHDSVTFTTVPNPATGIVNFLQQIVPGAALPQAADASASYKDSVYSIVTVL